MDRYFLSCDSGDHWQEVTKEKFVEAELGAGFRGGRPGEPATAGWSSGTMRGAVGLPHRVQEGSARLLFTANQVAWVIRDTFVCCDIYAKMAKLDDPADMAPYRNMKRSSDYHPDCYYGEWIAGLVEDIDRGSW